MSEYYSLLEQTKFELNLMLECVHGKGLERCLTANDRVAHALHVADLMDAAIGTKEAFNYCWISNSQTGINSQRAEVSKFA